MKFAFIAKHRAVWPIAWMCAALGVSRSGFHAWLTRQPSQRTQAQFSATFEKPRLPIVNGGSASP